MKITVGSLKKGKKWGKFVVLRENKNETHQLGCGLRLSGGNILVTGFRINRDFCGQLNNCNIYKKVCEPHSYLKTANCYYVKNVNKFRFDLKYGTH